MIRTRHDKERQDNTTQQHKDKPGQQVPAEGLSHQRVLTNTRQTTSSDLSAYFPVPVYMQGYLYKKEKSRRKRQHRTRRKTIIKSTQDERVFPRANKTKHAKARNSKKMK